MEDKRFSDKVKGTDSKKMKEGKVVRDLWGRSPHQENIN